MPSKHTVVVSLDPETELIVNNLGGNRSQWIRDAIKWRHGPGADLEVMEALADARKRQIVTAAHHMATLVRCLNHLEQGCALSGPTEAAIKQCEEWLEMR